MVGHAWTTIGAKNLVKADKFIVLFVTFVFAICLIIFVQALIHVSNLKLKASKWLLMLIY
jgi:hypothetical protein